ncbi:hypothetical protein QJQ45_004829 [Haematococcus lacustris]|nr:hypothetical protein QJQ45_004829 [Haematococcus lacustris]
MYVFGGEFTSPNQERFHHFKELWRLDLTNWSWDALPCKSGPSGRSGHRMVAYKNKVLLFGGYYDNGRDMRYYNDLWEFDVDSLRWSAVGNMAAGPWPSPRSGCQLVLHDNTLYLHGGYSKSRDEADPELEHGKAMDDCWACDLTTYKWERVKKAGMAPGPRSSFAMVTWRGRGFLFGGASDNEAKGGLDLSSEFHNDLYCFSCEKRRWFAAELRPSKAVVASTAPSGQPAASSTSGLGASQGAGSGSSQQEAARGSAAKEGSRDAPTEQPSPDLSPALQALLAAGRDKNSPIYRAAVKIQSQFSFAYCINAVLWTVLICVVGMLARGYAVRKAYKAYRLGGAISELLYSPAAYGLDMSTRNMPKPKARLGAQVCVVGNVLWLFGGTIEVKDKEVTLDDMWRLDLSKMDGWDLVKENTVGEDVFKQLAGAGSSSEYETDDGGSDRE